MTIPDTRVPQNASFPEIGAALLTLVDASLPMLRSISGDAAARSKAPEKWSAKEIVGHLIDSAANNHQRFIRAQQGPALTLPGYEQEFWVDRQRYRDRPWEDLVTLWSSYNQHLAHVIRHISETDGSKTCNVGESAPLSLRALAIDYVVHMQHHLDQIGARV
jgi:hypothetical protein